mgnify:FL=1
MRFSETLAIWYHTHKRDLPWRQTVDPYRVWLSEIILQQTRVDQGLPYFQRFIESYPSVSDLANATLDEVMRLWQGLGYYSRARNLHATAKQVLNEHGGNFPNTFDELISLPGVGPKSRRRKIGEIPTSPSARPRLRLISERRPNPAAAAPSLAVLTNSSRSESGDRNS